MLTLNYLTFFISLVGLDLTINHKIIGFEVKSNLLSIDNWCPK
jgi:hypothetical protein